MSDLMDQAQERTDMLLRHALEEQRLKGALTNGRLADQADWHVASASKCEGPHCGEPIPEDRRRLVPGVRLCVDCQARLEKGMGR